MDSGNGLKLPRGVWYEHARKRYRVRLYRNHTTFHAGYFDNEEDALSALESLKHRLASVPKHKRNAKAVGRVPSVNVGDMLRASREQD